MAGKWAKWANKLPRKLESDNRERIDAAKIDIAKKFAKGASEKEIIVIFASLQEEKKAIGEREKDINVLLAAISETIVDRWQGDINNLNEAEGTTSKKYDGIGTVFINTEPYCQFLNIQKLKPYLEKFKMLHLVKEDISWMSGNSFIKEQMEDGKELPEKDVVNVFIKQSLRIRKET